MVEAVLTECTLLLAGADAELIIKSIPWLEMALARGRWIEVNAEVLQSHLG
jgi:hypothetical protein